MQLLQNVAEPLITAIWYTESASETNINDIEQENLEQAWPQHLLPQHVHTQQQEQSKIGVQTRLTTQERDRNPTPTNIRIGIVPASQEIEYSCRLWSFREITSYVARTSEMTDVMSKTAPVTHET